MPHGRIGSTRTGRSVFQAVVGTPQAALACCANRALNRIRLVEEVNYNYDLFRVQRVVRAAGNWGEGVRGEKSRNRFFLKKFIWQAFGEPPAEHFEVFVRSSILPTALNSIRREKCGISANVQLPQNA